MSANVVGDIETMQIRHGDAIILRPRAELSDAKIHQLCNQLQAWLDYRRIKVHLLLMPHDCDIILLREDSKK